MPEKKLLMKINSKELTLKNVEWKWDQLLSHKILN